MSGGIKVIDMQNFIHLVNLQDRLDDIGITKKDLENYVSAILRSEPWRRVLKDFADKFREE
jgi:hypothetical protein